MSGASRRKGFFWKLQPSSISQQAAGQAGVEPQLAMKLLPEIWNNGLACLKSPESSFLRLHSPLACSKSYFREWHA